MELKMNNLKECFKVAKEKKAAWIAILVKDKNSTGEELIINPNINFDIKLAYYEKAYTDDLVLKSYDGIRIVGFTYGDTLTDIEFDLYDMDLKK